MDLGLFLPKVYHFVRQDYVINGKHFNQFISAYNASLHKSMILGITGFIAIAIAIAILFKVHISHTKKITISI